MVQGKCPSCGAARPIFAARCTRCGARNQMRSTGIAIAGALAALLVATVVATAVAVRGRALALASATAAAPVSQSSVAVGPGDAAALKSAMDACDLASSQDTDTLHFLVVPLASDAKDDADWLERSHSQVGNGVLLDSNEAVDALGRGALRIWRGEYDFRMRDDATSSILRWKPARGVASLSITDAGSISLFHVQFATPRRRADDEWGTAFVRQSGTCYWVTAILGH
jgi:hypothetical protein